MAKFMNIGAYNDLPRLRTRLALCARLIPFYFPLAIVAAFGLPSCRWLVEWG